MTAARRETLEPVVVGIDVGGPTKGFHAVAIQGSSVLETFHATSTARVAEWCRRRSPAVVAVDAPCRWRTAGGAARPAERQMAAEGISCYYAPTERRAREHAFYSWMLPGAELYRHLAPDFPLYTGGARAERCCIETFLHAVACALAGQLVSAKAKLQVRSALLAAAGFRHDALRTIDLVDAILCALAAAAFARGDFKSYGDIEGGFLIVPKQALTGRLELPARPAPRGSTALGKILTLVPKLTADERDELRAILSTGPSAAETASF